MSPDPTRHSFGDYELVGQVGYGRTARVYEAIYTPGGQRVAVKLFSPKLTAREGFGAEFDALIERLGGLDHPNIMPILDAGFQQGFYFIVTPLLKGRGVDALLKQSGALDAAAALGVIEQAAAALDYAAQHGVTHGAITPSNLLIDQDTGRFFEAVRVCDFGVAGLFARRVSVRPSGSIWLVGSPYTMAPELASTGKPTPEADRYSLGATLFELLTGQPPYAADDPADIVRAHVKAPIPSVLTTRPDLPAEVDGVIAAAMAKSPTVRPNRAAEIAASLQQALNVEPVIPAAPVVKRAASEKRPAPQRRTGVQRPRDDGGVPMWAVMGAAAGALVVAGLVVLLVGRAMWSVPSVPTPIPSPTKISNVGIPTDIVTRAPFVPTDTASPAPTQTRLPTFTPLPTQTPFLTETPTATITPTPRDTDTPGPTRTPTETQEGGELATPIHNLTYTPGAVFTLGVIHPQTPGAPSPVSVSILFVRDGQLFGINGDGTGLAQITRTDGLHAHPTRSAVIAFASDRDGNWEIYHMGANGIGLVRLTHHTATDFEPSAAKDGNVVFSSTRSGGTDIYVIRANGSLKRLTDDPAQDRFPNWSHDAKQIVFASNRDGGDFDLFTMNANGGDVRQITRTNVDETYPVWSPDGSRIAYLSSGNVMVLDLATGASTQLTSGGAVSALSWSLDGTQLVYASGGDLYVVGTDGGSPVRITSGGAQDSDPAWAK